MKKAKSQKSQVKSECGRRSFATFDFRLSTSSGGYTLLFAMIVASVVLAIGVSLLDVSRKEFILASSATQSSSAFYTADSGLSCAEYWDANSSAFASSTYAPGATNDAVQCDTAHPSRRVFVASVAGGTSDCPANASACSEFSFAAPFSTDGTTNLGCASTTVDKYYAADRTLPGSPVRLFTAITAAGFNIGWTGTDCSLASPRKLNRTIELTY